LAKLWMQIKMELKLSELEFRRRQMQTQWATLQIMLESVTVYANAKTGLRY
jgi:hypothetical protein